MNLIPEIEIGKEYLWTSSPIELLCSNCGANRGNGQGNYSIRVRVVRKSTVTYCATCEQKFSDVSEGWYAVNVVGGMYDGQRGDVPYTQLEPMEG